MCYKRGSPEATPPRMEQCTRAIVAQSNILGFTLEKVRIHKIMSATKSLPGTTNKCRALVLHPGNLDSVLEEHHQNEVL
jgi:hypothetical protein